MIETIKSITTASTTNTCGEAVAEVVMAVADEQTVEASTPEVIDGEVNEVVTERKRIVLREAKK